MALLRETLPCSWLVYETCHLRDKNNLAYLPSTTSSILDNTCWIGEEHW